MQRAGACLFDYLFEMEVKGDLGYQKKVQGEENGEKQVALEVVRAKCNYALQLINKMVIYSFEDGYTLFLYDLVVIGRKLYILQQGMMGWSYFSCHTLI